MDVQGCKVAQLRDYFQHPVCAGVVHLRQGVGCHVPPQVPSPEKQPQVPRHRLFCHHTSHIPAHRHCLQIIKLKLINIKF